MGEPDQRRPTLAESILEHVTGLIKAIEANILWQKDEEVKGQNQDGATMEGKLEVRRITPTPVEKEVKKQMAKDKGNMGVGKIEGMLLERRNRGHPYILDMKIGW